MDNFKVNSDPNQAYGFSSEYARFNIRKMVRNRTDKNGMTKVIIEVCQYTYSGTGQYSTKFKRISTDVWVDPKNWNQKKELVNGKDSEADVKNKDIDKVFMAVKEYINSKGRQTPDQAYVERMNLAGLSEFFPSRPENRKTLIDYFDIYIKHRENNGTCRNTLKEFTTVKNRLQDFDKYRNRKTYLEDINFTWSDDFHPFLMQKYSAGTIEKTYTVLATVLNHFYRRRDELQLSIPDKFKLKGFKHGKKSVNDANPLSRTQLETLCLHEFKEHHLKKTKDRFIWQCYTGCRYSDAFTITSKNISITSKKIKNKTVKYVWLTYKPSKTTKFDVKAEQPVNPVALEMLEKYEYDMTKLKITNQAYNRDLKEMFEKLNETYPKLKYDIHFGSYASRDTFISLCVDEGVNWHNILKYVGQSSFIIMNRYVKTDRNLQQQEMNRVFPKPVARSPESN